MFVNTLTPQHKIEGALGICHSPQHPSPCALHTWLHAIASDSLAPERAQTLLALLALHRGCVLPTSHAGPMLAAVVGRGLNGTARDRCIGTAGRWAQTNRMSRVCTWSAPRARDCDERASSTAFGAGSFLHVCSLLCVCVCACARWTRVGHPLGRLCGCVCVCAFIYV